MQALFILPLLMSVLAMLISLLAAILPGVSGVPVIMAADFIMLSLVQAIIVVLIVLGGSVDIFIWKQVITVRHEIDERRKFVEDYEKNGVPLMNDFITKLQAFTKTNADFAPILMKYLRLLSPPATAPRQATTNK